MLTRYTPTTQQDVQRLERLHKLIDHLNEDAKPYTPRKYKAVLINKNNGRTSEPYSFASSMQRTEFITRTNDKSNGYFIARIV